MKQIYICIITMFFLTACSGDNIVDRNYLGKNYNTSMKSIDLSGLQLTKIPDFSSYGTGEVFFNAVSINLSDNDITRFTANDFSELKYLKNINLSANNIKGVNKLNLTLDILDLHDNDLERIHFSSGASIENLDLAGNKLRFGADLKLPSNMLKLDLSGNMLENLDNFSNFTRLKYLDISDNQLGDLDLIVLKGKNHIKYLDIQGNPDMSQQRIDIVNVFNQKYVDKNNGKTRSNSDMKTEVIK